MNQLVATKNHIAPMAPDAIEKVRLLEAEVLKQPQVQIKTEHVIHGGIYSRTIMVPAGTVTTGVLIKVPTVLIVSGRCLVFIGDERVEVDGYKVFAGSALRKQAVYCIEDTFITMIVASDAHSIEQAEDEFTDEAHMLGSRSSEAVNEIFISGE